MSSYSCFVDPLSPRTPQQHSWNPPPTLLIPTPEQQLPTTSSTMEGEGKRKREEEPNVKVESSTSSSSSSSSTATSSSVMSQQQMEANMKMMSEQMQQMKEQLAQANKKQKVEPAADVFNLTSDGRRKVTVRTWQNRLQIDIRDFYKDKNDEWKPTKKGVALKPEEFAKLVSWIPQIKQAVEDRS